MSYLPPHPRAVEARVDRAERLSPHVLLLGLHAPDFATRPFRPGDKVKLAAPGGPLRSYTPLRMLPEEGRLEIIVHLHGKGPTATWAASAPVGDRIGLLGPARSLRETTPPADLALFYGDETALGLAAALAEALPPERPLDGVVELAPEDVGAATAVGLAIGRPRLEAGVEAVRHAEEVDLAGDVRVWLSGRAETVQAVHDVLRRRGLPREALVVKPYWSEGGAARRKAIARALL